MLYRPWIAQHYDKPTGERPALGYIPLGLVLPARATDRALIITVPEGALSISTTKTAS